MDIFSPYETSACIDLIFALATNYTVRARTVVELSLSRFFKGSIVVYSGQLEDILHLGRIKKAGQKKESK